jgi:hypothetical protein
MVGRGKGHTDYSTRTGARHFRTWTTWLSLILAIALPFWTRDAQSIGELIGQNTSAGWIAATPFITSYVLIWILFLIIAQIIAKIRIRLENSLRSRFAKLLDLPGRG